MMTKHDDEHPSSMVFCKDQYKSEIEMWNDMTSFLQMLMRNEYVAVIRCDEPGLGIYCVDYGYADPKMGCDMPYWLSEDEVELIEAEKGENDAEIH